MGYYTINRNYYKYKVSILSELCYFCLILIHEKIEIMSLNKEQIKAQIDSLRSELEKHNYNYYVLSNPEITDFEFDKKLHELQKLEADNPEFFDPLSPTQRVGSDISNEFVQVEHRYPMLSLGNTYSAEEVTDFYERTRKTLQEDFTIVAELKYDGTSISVTYENGELLRAVTRGDGTRGDDVTNNVKTIRSVPLKLREEGFPAHFEMRGEILMPWAVFDGLNKEREEQEEPLFANPRNAASGTLKLQNSSVVAQRRLDAYFYYMMSDTLPTDSHYENLQLARSWGFKVPETMKRCTTLDEIFEFINYWDVERKNLPVATDGIVLKVDSITQQQELGYTAKSPRWAISYKFQAEQALTRLNSVSYQVGRTGAVTPVANLDAVQLSGTVVKRASLHNADIIESLDLHIGDMVYVEKGGEIIPKIVGVDKDARLLIGEKVQFIKNCPECGTPLDRIEGEAAFYCPNDTGCPPQIKGRIEHFLTRRAMNIAAGPETVDTLYSAELIKNVADLYDLSFDDLIALPRWKEKSVQNLLSSLEQSKQVPFERVLFGLGIRYVGETVAKKLAAAFKNIDALEQASYDALIEVDEIGDRIARSVLEYFDNVENKAMVERLRTAGLQLAIKEVEGLITTDKLKGVSIVISGTFKHHSRDEYKELILANGGKNPGSVSGKTNYLLAGEGIGPSKLDKATKLGVTLLSEEEFLQMIQD